MAEDLAAVATRLQTDLAYLSSDALAGRDVGSEGIAKAGEYIARDLQIWDSKRTSSMVVPIKNSLSRVLLRLGPLRKTSLSLLSGWIARIEIGRQLCPLSLGSSGQFDSQVIFAGFGITAPELDYDDYAGLDVEGKVVIILRREPQQADPKVASTELKILNMLTSPRKN